MCEVKLPVPQKCIRPELIRPSRVCFSPNSIFCHGRNTRVFQLAGINYMLILAKAQAGSQYQRSFPVTSLPVAHENLRK